MANVADMDAFIPFDNDWVRASFLLPNEFFSNTSNTESYDNLVDANITQYETTKITTNNQYLKYMYWSSASLKITNTQLGGNLGVNCKPQFTRYADIRVPGLVYNNKVSISVIGKNGQLEPNAINIGMGRYYSEAIDDKAQRIYMRFGVPMFNTLGNFLSNAFNYGLSDLANTGRAPGVFYYTGKAIGGLVSFTALPLTSVLLTSASAIASLSKSLGFSTYYTMKPAMSLYWSAVNDLVNQIATYRGILPGAVLSDYLGNPLHPGGSPNIAQELVSSYNKLLPHVFTPEGALNVFAFANKTQLMFNTVREHLNQVEKGITPKEMNYDFYISQVSSAARSKSMTPMKMIELMNKYKSTIGTLNSSPAKNSNKSNPNVSNNSVPIETMFYINSTNNAVTKPDQKGVYNFTNYLKAEASAGGGWAIFVVDSTGSQSESFSNDVGETGIASTLNGIESSRRNIEYDTDDYTALGVQKVINSVLGHVKSLAVGTLDGTKIGGIVNFLFGSGFIEIPKFWTGSSAQLPHADYTFDLISPYGNPISQLQNIYLPLAMLMVGALPLATGKQSYTSPFLCQIFDRGKVQIQLGMIDSLSITRGTTNLPFNQEWRMLGCKVSVSVVDMSNIMFIPLSDGSFFNVLMKRVSAGAYNYLEKNIGWLSPNTLAGKAAQVGAGFLEMAATDTNNVLYDYLLTIAGADAQNALYNVSKSRLALANNVKYASELTSSAYWANKMYGVASNTFLGGIFANLYAGFSINAEIQSPAQLATQQVLHSILP